MESWKTKQLPERLPFSKKRLPKRVIFSYIVDYLIIFILIGIFTIVDKIAPFHQQFSLQNYTLHYPYAKKERVPVFWLLVLVVAVPAAIIAFYTLVVDGLFSHQTAEPVGRTGIKRLTGRYRLKDRLWELNCGVLGLGLSVGAAFTITGALKNAIGKPRPDLIDRCVIDAVKVVDEAATHKLQTIAICTQTNNYILQDGFKSFPSGHSSVSFAGLFYLSIYLAAKLHCLDAKGEVWRTFIVMVPTLGAALITGTRIMDARHHPFDVISGAMLGILTAWGSYRQYFPPVSETWRKGRAYPIRAWGRGPSAPPNPAIVIDEDVQPLRPIIQSSDMERGEASGFSSVTAVSGGTGDNVFRQQISNSQQRREQEAQYGVDRSDTLASSNYRSDTMDSTMSHRVSKYQGQMPTSNPFSTGPRLHRTDTYDYSSSEDGDNIELRQQRYNPVQGRFTDTGYHPPAGVTPTPTPPPPQIIAGAPSQNVASPTGDLSDRREAPPTAPVHALGTTGQSV